MMKGFGNLFTAFVIIFLPAAQAKAGNLVPPPNFDYVHMLNKKLDCDRIQRDTHCSLKLDSDTILYFSKLTSLMGKRVHVRFSAEGVTKKQLVTFNNDPLDESYVLIGEKLRANDIALIESKTAIFCYKDMALNVNRDCGKQRN
jgi:hypothetical protein